MNRKTGFLVGVLMLAALPLLAGCGTSRGYNVYNNNAPNTPKPVPSPRLKPPTPIQQLAQRGAQPGHVIVQRGDTVYAISRRTGAPVQEIIAVNRMRPPYALEVGQRVNLPTPRYHTVRKGETAYGISRRYDVDLTSLTRLNNIPAPYTLSVGQKLRLPQSGTAIAVASPPARTTAPRSSPPRGTSTAPPSKPMAPPPPRSGRGFDWPATGQLISAYGPKPGGLHNDGINISVTRGAPVRASEDGVVAYTGAELKGFGQLVLVRHADGWVTAYAHNQKILVSKGDKVKRGQRIAEAGSSGNVDAPQVHFELRQGTKAVDPMRYLPKRSASRQDGPPGPG